jgi:PQQ-like domain
VQPIPLGVADDGRLAVVRTREGTLLAIDPATGSTRWRAGSGLRPCAVTAGAVVAVRLRSASPPAVVVLDASDGSELWSAAIPAAAPLEAADPSSLELDCALRDDEVLLRWATSTHYEGGAAPSRRLLAEHSSRASGGARIDLRARSVTVTGPPDADPGVGEAAASAAPAAAAVGPDVVQHGRLGDLRLELATPPATGSVVLRGVDAASDAVVWEVVVDEQARRRPPPLRP